MARHQLEALLAGSLLWDAIDGGALVVACSGGADSVALLLAAHRLLADPGFTKRFASPPVLAAWHLDHGLRADSERDAQLVASLCNRLGVKCIPERWEGPPPGGNLEQQAREERYTRLASLLSIELPNDDLPMPRVAVTAHHLDDQAETILHNIVRGTHLRGLRGIAPVLDQNIFRPWLEATRQQITGYLADLGEKHAQDPTNADTSLTRNRLRHNVMPELLAINPQARQHLARLAETSADMQALLQQRLAALEVVSHTAISLAGWLPLMAAPVGRYFVYWIQGGWGSPALLAELAASKLNKPVWDDYQVLANWSDHPASELVIRQARLRTIAGSILSISFPSTPKPASQWLIFSPGDKHGVNMLSACCDEATSAAWNDLRQQPVLPWQHIRSWPDFLSQLPAYWQHSATWTCFLNGSAEPPFTLRAWREGDRITLKDGSTKKLGDLFTDAKVPLLLRFNWSVLTDANDAVLWVPGLADSVAMDVAGGQHAYVIRLSSLR